MANLLRKDANSAQIIIKMQAPYQNGLKKRWNIISSNLYKNPQASYLIECFT
jgi:hypothetical protein